MRDRLLGILLFLPVPFVLWLFTRAPIGVAASLGLGVLVMVTHSLYARPFALGRSRRRCLWCGGAAGPAATADGERAIELIEPRGRTRWHACQATHRRSLDNLLRWGSRRAVWLRAGILGSLLLLLAGSAIIVIGGGSRTGSIQWESATLEFADLSALFRLGVALTVLPLGWLGPAKGTGSGNGIGNANATTNGKPDATRNANASPSTSTSSTAGEEEPIRTPFPVHIQALIGTVGVVWLFRAIGLLWLVQGLRHLLAR